MRAAAERRSRGSGSGIPGTYWTPGLGRLRVVAGHRPDADSPQDCQSVRIYASELCPRQDSNLRSRLRSPFPCIAVACRNVLLNVLPGRISGTTRIVELPGLQPRV